MGFLGTPGWLIGTSIVAMLGALSAASASEVWHNDWLPREQPTFSTFVPGGLDVGASYGFASNGDLLVLTSEYPYGGSRTGYQFVAVTPAGQLRWTSTLASAYTKPFGFTATLADASGSVFFALQGEYGDRIVRYGASGALTWARDIESNWLAAPATGRLASLGCRHLTVLDSADGKVVWERTLSSPNVTECRSGLTADAAGNLYAALETGSPVPPQSMRSHIAKFDAVGHPQWDVPIAGGDLFRIVGAGSTNIYVQTDSALRAFRAVDGSVAWTVPLPAEAEVRMSADATPEPVVADSNGVERFNGETGQLRWTQAATGRARSPAIIGNSVVVSTSSGVARMDLASGAIAWTNAGGNFTLVGFGGFDGTSFFGIASVDGHRGLVKRIAVADGALSDVALPAVDTGVFANSVVDEVGDVVSAGMVGHAEQVALHVRRLQGATGTPAFDVVDADLCCTDWSLTVPGVAARGSTVAVAFASSATCDNGQLAAGTVSVNVYERGTGVRRWRAVPYEQGDGCTQISTPVIDANGDVYATERSIVQSFPQGVPTLEVRQTLYKFAASTGEILWRLDTYPIGNDYLFYVEPQYFSLVGSDVLLVGPFGGSTDTLRRLSGVDGSTVWASTVFQENGLGEAPRVIDSNHVAVFSGTNAEVTWASIDTDTGQTQWTASAPFSPCNNAPSCSLGGYSSIQSHGDTVSGGERDFAPLLTRYHNDGSGTVDRWAPGTGNASVRGALQELWADPAGDLKTFLYYGFGANLGSLRFSSPFDYASGTLRAKQFIYAFTPNAPVEFPSPLGNPAPTQLLASTFGALSGNPATSGATLFDTTISAHGNLSVTLAMDHSHVQPGEAVGFHLAVHYAGDATVTGVRLAALMPWQSGIDLPVVRVRIA